MRVRVLRGRADSPVADRETTRRVLREVAETGVPAVRAWTPHRQLAFGRRDANEPGYPEARAAAEAHDFPPVERSVGGRAVAYAGTTVAFASLEPVEDSRRGLTERYEAATDSVVSTLRSLGVDAESGEPPNSFCPGDHSVQARAAASTGESGPYGKLSGIAQRVTKGAAMVAGVVVVADADEIRAVLEPVYDALDVPFDPAAVGSVADSGGPSDPEPVCRALEDAFAGDRKRTVEPVDPVESTESGEPAESAETATQDDREA